MPSGAILSRPHRPAPSIVHPWRLFLAPIPPLLHADITRHRRSQLLFRFDHYVRKEGGALTGGGSLPEVQRRYGLSGTAHGSFVSSLFGPLSDMDLLLEVHPRVGLLSKAKKVEILTAFKKGGLKKKRNIVYTNRQVVGVFHARVPVLKFRDAATKYDPLPESWSSIPPFASPPCAPPLPPSACLSLALYGTSSDVPAARLAPHAQSRLRRGRRHAAEQVQVGGAL